MTKKRISSILNGDKKDTQALKRDSTFDRVPQREGPRRLKDPCTKQVEPALELRMKVRRMSGVSGWK